MGEAAAMLVIEDIKEARKNKRQPLARIKSVCSYFDAHSIAKIHPGGRGIEKAIRDSLDAAGAKPEEIDYIAGCANSTVDLDRIEVKALKKIFGKHLDGIPVSSIKSMVGETLSVSGSLQLIAAIGALQHGIIPPTINFKRKDADCDIDCVPNKPRKAAVKKVLVTSFGAGGYNSACIVEKA